MSLIVKTYKRVQISWAPLGTFKLAIFATQNKVTCSKEQRKNGAIQKKTLRVNVDFHPMTPNTGCSVHSLHNPVHWMTI